VPETVTLEEALELLEEFGYRCVPVLDESGTIYRGNIYRMHIYKHKSEGKDMTLPVTHLLKNATKNVHTTTSFYSIFIMIKDLSGKIRKKRYDSFGNSFIKKCDKVCAYFFFFL